MDLLEPINLDAKESWAYNVGLPPDSALC